MLAMLALGGRRRTTLNSKLVWATEGDPASKNKPPCFLHKARMKTATQKYNSPINICNSLPGTALRQVLQAAV